MPQHENMRQQILMIALTAFNQYGNALTMDQLTGGLSACPNSLHPYFNNKTELIRQLVSFTLTRIRKPTFSLAPLSLTEELWELLATYRELLTVFSHIALLDLKLHSPEEWGNLMELRESQWKRIAAAINSGIASGQLRPVDTKLVQIMTDGMLLDPFRQVPLSLAELLDMLLFGIARRAP
ncbi:TetR/AcrR family transcriptional regulator [Anaerosinus massiliensis]|uniref:TetR/AcrR family transcriptional regulator n=1 Tax=Massilibacillus massiliensis TaxID=1806837 RepID=UPI000DA5F1F1|nr:TetR/AcrR family transcriptional regulator [Massilibacillus massiliensis]